MRSKRIGLKSSSCPWGLTEYHSGANVVALWGETTVSLPGRVLPAWRRNPQPGALGGFTLPLIRQALPSICQVFRHRIRHHMMLRTVPAFG
jgi:hypothetical protein